MLSKKPSDLRPASKNQVDSDYPHKNQVIDHHTEQVNFGPHSQFRPPLKKQACLDPNTKAKSNSIPHKNKLISTPPLESRQLDTHSQMKSISMPRHENLIYFDPTTTTKYFSIPTQKPSQFRSRNWYQVKFNPPHWNQVNSYHPYKNEVKFDAHTKNKWFSARIQKPSKFRPPTQKPSQSIPALKTSHFRPAHKNQVNFDPNIKTK